MKRSGYQDKPPQPPKKARKSPEMGRNNSSNDRKPRPGIQKPKTSPTKKLAQAVLQFKGDELTTTCSICSVTYRKQSKTDREYHNKAHDLHVNGLLWPFPIKKLPMEFIVKTPKAQKIVIVEVDTSSEPQLRRVDEALAIVNKELNASEGSSQWKSSQSGSIQAKALLAIADARIIGLCTTEVIEDIQKQSRWMVHSTRSVVESQVNKNAVVGISRIWVLNKWRRLGIAEKLLDVVVHNSAYGITLEPKTIAFSQPSTSGGLLAKRFNGVVHKSGEVLIPVYLED